MVSLKNNPEWIRAARIFGEISTWVIVPIVVALILGKYLDGRFDTKPWIFLSATILAFIVTFTGIARILTKYIKEIDEEVKNKKNGTDGSTK